MLQSQTHVKGRVIDAVTNEPLAFANVAAPETGQGNMTDIDGYFEIRFSTPVDSFIVTYVGYEQTKINISHTKTNYLIELKPVNFELTEVTVTPGINPAHRIIRKAVGNREDNDPESEGAFTLVSYNKLIVNPDQKLWRMDTATLDSSAKKVREVFSDKHIFIMETAGKRYFEAPDKFKEEVIQTQVSGLKNPFFFVLASQLQSFTFYHDLINIAGYRLVNPISKRSTKKYWFRIEDTTFVNGPTDTVFTISFSKRGDRSFNGMKGVVQIGSRDYAIRSVIASPDISKKANLLEIDEDSSKQEKPPDIDIKIRQKYEKINGEKWFPVQLNMDITLHNLTFGGVSTVIEGRTSIRNIRLMDDLDNKIFDENFVVMNKDAAKRNDSLLNQFRMNPLTSKEKNTYHLIDSISQTYKLEELLRFYRILMDGFIPVGPFNVDLSKFIAYNEFEGWRFGAGMSTNNVFSNIWQPSAYFAWSTSDKAWKYGAGLDIHLWDKHELEFKAKYHNDVREVGSLPQFGQKSLIDESNFRNFLIKRMDYEKLALGSFYFRALKYAEIETGLRYRELQFFKDLQYGVNTENAYIGVGNINTTEVFTKIRYAFRERYMKTPLSKTSLGTKYPVIWLGYTKGFNAYHGQVEYQKIDFQIKKTFHSKYLGSSDIFIRGGKVTQGIPILLQYAGFGSYYDFTIACPGTFNTMRINEFAADQYIAVHLEHNFKKHLVRSKFFQPSIAVTTSALWGSWTGQELHRNINFKKPNKGYYESGLRIQNILKSSFSTLGVAFYYRYGPYEFDRVKDNLSVKLVSGISL